ncbi:uncharacterized protein LOC119673811 [Teleopsis dalmanni]|uniref:uncharacterized protein LOC119673390 n=1 Tax=Teleopsis dalmanni TaxID=139649 RepID=UPI0018CEE2CE|nr:uncharacterized protein LOC119673390 [Teleopsis dalmanni]XP_037940839.1 uncharacterized protein LOC119673811 [Teleopsis dalmanni]
MKLLLITFAIIGFAAAAQLPDSATQGPNPQDIATPEPEYIDIDLPEPPRPAAPAPAPVQHSSFVSVPHPVQRPVVAASSASFARAPQQIYLPPQASYQAPVQVPGHSYSRNSGYQYRRPVYVRRVYYRRRY